MNLTRLSRYTLQKYTLITQLFNLLDPDNLIALQNEEVPVILTVTEFENTTIPCKPTSPDVQVTLKNDVEEVVCFLLI